MSIEVKVVSDFENFKIKFSVLGDITPEYIHDCHKAGKDPFELIGKEIAEKMRPLYNDL